MSTTHSTMRKRSVPLQEQMSGAHVHVTPMTRLKSVFVYFQYLQVFVNEVTALVPLLRDGHFAFAVYTPERTKQRWPLILAAHSEQDVNDWVTVDKTGLQS